jgi:hypothetical protein
LDNRRTIVLHGVIHGNLDLDPGNGTLLTLTDLASTPNPFIEDTTILARINYSGGWNGGLFTFGTNVLADGERFMAGSPLWEIDYNRTSPIGLANFTNDSLPNSRFVAITAVPEPSTLVLLGIGGVLACWAARQGGLPRGRELRMATAPVKHESRRRSRSA